MTNYERIILAKNNWPIFDNYFHSTYEFQRHMSAVVRFRNGIKHNRDVHQVERLTGEAGIIWLREALGVKKPIAAPQVIEEIKEGQQPVENQERPSPEDYYRLLTRIAIPFGQKHLYKVLYVAGEPGVSYQELHAEVGQGKDRRLPGLFGALTNRVNGTPGYGKRHKPGKSMVYFWHLEGEYKGRMALQPEMRAALETLDPDWLHGELSR